MEQILKSLQSSAPECLGFACGDVYMCPGHHLQDCILPVTVCVGNVDDSFATWIIEGGEPLYLIKSGTNTLIYMPSTDMVYSADPQFVLKPESPNHTTLRGQFILEKTGPRILIFDAIRIDGSPMVGTPPAKRYATLQANTHWFNGVNLVLQWCGNGAALLGAIKSKSFQVPHTIHSVVALTTNPVVLERLG